MKRLLLAAALPLWLGCSAQPGVEALRDLSYTAGQPEDAARHQLDIYRPASAHNATVLLFIHGGAWSTGDRSQYTALGKRFAQEGILTAAPSYRLAPGNQHPAGGHLAALLSLDPRYLQALGLSSRNIRGVIALSGVYEIRGPRSVFGSDPGALEQASPLRYVSASAPPFLIGYCERDFATLPAQARLFHRALREAGVPAELLFIPGQGHISEILHMAAEDDPIVQAMLRFMQR